MAFWKICWLFGLLLIESVLHTSAAPIGGSDRCGDGQELSLRYFEQDLDRKVVFFDIITKAGTVLNTTFHNCQLVSAHDAKGKRNAEAIAFELIVRLERPLLKVVIDKNNSVAFSQNRDRARRVATLICDDLEIKCIQFQLQGNEIIGKHSLGFVNRKLLSTKSKERNMVDPFVAVSVAFAGVLLLVLVLGLCASCHGKEESLSPVNSVAQLVSVTHVKPVADMPVGEPEKRESKTISAEIASVEKADTAKHNSLVRGSNPEATAAVPKDSNTLDVRLSADITHESRSVDDVFEQGGQLVVKGRRSKGSKGSTSSNVSTDRSSRGSAKIEEEHRQEKVEVSEHKDERHHKDEKRHKSDKLHGLKKKLSIKSGKRTSLKDDLDENDETLREKGRESSKKDKRSLSEKGRNSKGLADEISVETGHRPKCPSPPHDQTSRELPKLPCESDPSIFNPPTAARPLPQRVFSEPAATSELDNYESVDVRSREVRSVSAGEADLLYETVETKTKETINFGARPSSGVSQQYEAVDFQQLSRIAMKNRTSYNERGDKYTEVPDSASSSGAKNVDDKSVHSSSDSDLYALVKDDGAENPVLDLYAEVDKVKIGAQMESNPTIATDLYAEPDKPFKGRDASNSSEEQGREQHIPAPPSVDTLKSLSESGRILTATDSSLSSASITDGSHVTLAQDQSKTVRVFHRETDLKKLEQMYSKIDLSTKRRLSGIEVESSGSAVTESVRDHRVESDIESGDEDDDATPPPIPSSLYAPLPTAGEGGHAINGGKEVVISQEETEKRTSKTSLTYEEIGPTKSAEKQTNEIPVHSTDAVNCDDDLLTVNTTLSVESNRLSTNSEAYEEIGSLRRPGVDYKKEVSTNGIDGNPVAGMVKISSYEDLEPQTNSNSVAQEHDKMGSTAVQPETVETVKSIKSESINGNGEVIKTLDVLPRNEEDNTSGYYESLENIVAPPAVPADGNKSSSTGGLGSSVSNDPSIGVSLYEEVEVRKEEKKTKHSRFSSKKLKTLGHI